MEINFLQAYLITIVLETLVLYLLLRGKYSASLIVRNSILANTITLPLVWFAFPQFGITYEFQILFSELFAFGAEALIFLRAFPKIRLQDAIVASFSCNTVSYLSGIILS